MHPAQAVQATLLTPGAIARELGVHPSAPLRWIQRGALLSSGDRVKLTALRTPGGWRVRREDLDQFLRVLTADRLPPDSGDVAKPHPNTRRVRKLKSDLAQAGF
jgi:hypothetical protein